MKRSWLISISLCIFISGCQISNIQTPKTAYEKQTHDSEQRIIHKPVKTTQTPDLKDGTEYAHRIPQPLSLADLHKKYRSNFILSGSPDKRAVALTFDDGPDDIFTPQVLDALKRENVKATFFLIGNRMEKHPDITKRIIAEGHAIGNHSYNHPNFAKLDDPNFRNQIQRTDAIFNQFFGYRPVIIRPPYGNITENQIQWLVSQRKKIINWNVDSLDWKGLNATQVSTNILADVKPGAIILQHSAGGTGEDLSGTVQAIPEIIQKIKADGAEFVTIPELLELDNRLPAT